MNIPDDSPVYVLQTVAPSGALSPTGPAPVFKNTTKDDTAPLSPDPPVPVELNGAAVHTILLTCL